MRVSISGRNSSKIERSQHPEHIAPLSQLADYQSLIDIIALVLKMLT